jgi:hypothetical protein
MKELAIRTTTRAQGEFALASLHDAVDMDRVKLDDVAMVSVAADGTTEMHRTTGVFHRHAIEKKELERLAHEIEPGEALVILRGPDEQVDAVGARARALTRGDMRTYEVTGDGLTEVTGTGAAIELEDASGLLVEASDGIPVQTSILVKAPIS